MPRFWKEAVKGLAVAGLVVDDEPLGSFKVKLAAVIR